MSMPISFLSFRVYCISWRSEDERTSLGLTLKQSLFVEISWKSARSVVETYSAMKL